MERFADSERAGADERASHCRSQSDAYEVFTKETTSPDAKLATSKNRCNALLVIMIVAAVVGKGEVCVVEHC